MKHTLKIFFTLFACVYIFTKPSFAEPRACGTWEYCAVQNQTIAEIDIYIENNKKAIENITVFIRNNATIWEAEDDKKTIREYMVWMINQSVEWESFDELFDFYVTSAMESTVPDAMYRDYQKLMNESQRIQKLLNMVSDRNYDDITITKEIICKDVNGVCSTNNKDLWGSLWSTLGLIYQNNIDIKRLYRLAINGQEAEFKKQNSLFFIPNISNANSWLDSVNAMSRSHFSQTITKYYGANAVAECNMCNGWSYAEIAESIKSIAQTLKWQSDGYKSWKDAWNLLIWWKEASRKAANERMLLERELSRQGVSTRNSEIILWNLDEYNNPENEDGRAGGFTWWNNFISNSYNSFINDTRNDLDTFESSIDSTFYEEANDPDNDMIGAYTSVEKLIEDKAKIDRSVLIAQDIDELYRLHLEHAQKDDLYWSQLIGRIVSTHNNLVEAIVSLKQAQPIAEEVCDSQAAGRWKCSYWNHK